MSKRVRCLPPGCVSNGYVQYYFFSDRSAGNNVMMLLIHVWNSDDRFVLLSNMTKCLQTLPRAISVTLAAYKMWQTSQMEYTTRPAMILYLAYVVYTFKIPFPVLVVCPHALMICVSWLYVPIHWKTQPWAIAVPGRPL